MSERAAVVTARSSFAQMALPAAVMLALALAVLGFVRGNYFSLSDDAYIYFRYAANLARGCGLRFNCGDSPVEGYTSPLYLLLLATARLLTRDLVTVSTVLGALFTMATISFATASAWSERWGPRRAARYAVVAVAASLFALDHVILVNSVTGMDTALACAVVSAWFFGLTTARHRVVAVALVLAALARPECVLLLLVTPLVPDVHARRSWLPGVAALALLLLHRILVFHDVVPNTYWAKAGGTARHLELGLSYLLAVLGSEPLIALAPLALLVRGLRREIGCLLLVTLIWFAFFLRSGGDSFLYDRLAAPLIAPLIVTALRGLAAVGDLVAARLPRAGRLVRWLSPALVAAAAAVIPLGWSEHRLDSMHEIPDVGRWALVGKYLRAAHPGATIATVPIGAIGYYSDARVIDLVGLVTPAVARAGRTVPPEMLRANWIGHERHNTEWVLSQRPDLIVMNRYRATPFTDVRQAVSSFFAEWLLLREIKAGRAPYRLYSAPIAPGLHWLMFRRADLSALD